MEAASARGPAMSSRRMLLTCGRVKCSIRVGEYAERERTLGVCSPALRARHRASFSLPTGEAKGEQE